MRNGEGEKEVRISLFVRCGLMTASNYPHSAFPYLAALVPAEVYHIILSPLLSLLSRFAAHSHLSGLTPHAISSLFAGLLFDVPTSVSCLQSHAVFVQAAWATEHLLLSYIRWSGQGEGLGVTDLPGRLKEWVSGYPSMLPSDADLARAIPRRGSRILRCERVSRTVRAYSRDLFVSAESWNNDVESWPAWDTVMLKARRGEASRPKFSNAWKRRMAIKDHISLPPSAASHRPAFYGRATKPPANHMREARNQMNNREEQALWGSLAGKEWSIFEEGGFDAPISSDQGPEDMQARLQFDLNESTKKVRRFLPTRIALTSRASRKRGKQWHGPNLLHPQAGSLGPIHFSTYLFRLPNPSRR